MDDTSRGDDGRARGNAVGHPDGTNVSRRSILFAGTALAATSSLTSLVTVAQAQEQPAAPASAGGKPNILVIWGDDIGIANISAYSNGLMGYETPNIDRIAREGLKFQ